MFRIFPLRSSSPLRLPFHPAPRARRKARPFLRGGARPPAPSSACALRPLCAIPGVALSRELAGPRRGRGEPQRSRGPLPPAAGAAGSQCAGAAPAPQPRLERMPAVRGALHAGTCGRWLALRIIVLQAKLPARDWAVFF